MATSRPDEPTLTSQQAADYLGIKLQTLYAYVSRGWLKGSGGARREGRRYRRDDLEPLRARQRGPAAAALRFGEPVLETRITRITPHGPAYRGRLAVELARSDLPFAAVAELLWTGTLPTAAPRWPVDGAPPLPARALAKLLPAGSPPLAALALALPALAAADLLRWDADADAVLARARLLLPRLASCFALALEPARLESAKASGEPERALAGALGLPAQPRPLGLLRAALVLCADHELNPSSFAARIAASTGGDLYACLSAAVATFSGPRHGASEQVELLAQDAQAHGAEAAIGHRLRRGERIAGFGHPLYPDGDPRATVLLELSRAARPKMPPRLRAIVALVDAAERAGKPRPNLDVGLAAVGAALDLPVGVGPAIFATGRMAGWVANVVEQQQTAHVLRPRARFVGDVVGDDPAT